MSKAPLTKRRWGYDVKDFKASEIAELLACAYARCNTQQERQLLADLVSELGKLVTYDYRQFALEVLDRTAGKLPVPVQLPDDEEDEEENYHDDQRKVRRHESGWAE